MTNEQPPADDASQRDLATVELLGALAYGQLRAFEVCARAIRHAPDARRMDRVATFAAREHHAYTQLRDELIARTDLPAAVVDRQKERFDAYFDAAPVDEWIGACSFFAAGLPIAADFTREVAPLLDDDIGAVLIGALAERHAFERFALDQLRELIADDPAAADRARHLIADILGRALTGFQGALTDTDALKILFTDAAAHRDESAEALVKQLAIRVLSGHRHRMHSLGLEDLE